jgi:hypothetical protein
VRAVRGYAAALTVLAAMVTGCGDGSPGADPSDSSSPTESGSPTESSSPSVEPATGKRVESLSFTFRAPQGWRTSEGQTSSLLTTRYTGDESPDGSVTAFLGTADGRALLGETLDKLARKKAGSSEYDRPPRILDSIEVDGVEMYRVAGQVARFKYVIAIGAIYGDNLVEAQIETDTLSPGELEDVFASILASWKWK